MISCFVLKTHKPKFGYSQIRMLFQDLPFCIGKEQVPSCEMKEARWLVDISCKHSQENESCALIGSIPGKECMSVWSSQVGVGIALCNSGPSCSEFRRLCRFLPQLAKLTLITLGGKVSLHQAITPVTTQPSGSGNAFKWLSDELDFLTSNT